MPSVTYAYSFLQTAQAIAEHKPVVVDVYQNKKGELFLANYEDLTDKNFEIIQKTHTDLKEKKLSQKAKLVGSLAAGDFPDNFVQDPTVHSGRILAVAKKKFAAVKS